MHWLCDGLSLTPKGAFEEKTSKDCCIKKMDLSKPVEEEKFKLHF